MKNLYQSALALVRQNRRAYIVINAGYYGLVFIFMIVSAFNRPLQDELINTIRRGVHDGSACGGGKCLVNAEILKAIGLTFLVNLVIGAFMFPDAPPLSADRDGTSAATYWTATGRGVALVVPLGGEGPCAFLLARIPPRQGELRDQAQALAPVIIRVLAAAWVAAGPIIARLRRLAEEVRRSAASRYAEPVSVEGQDEMAALPGAFNEAGQSVRAHLMDVQAREQALRAFVANTTHDVAIPLTVLQGQLAELDRGPSTPEQREHMRGAMQEAHYMASLLRNLATATTLDEPNATPVPGSKSSINRR